MFLSNTDWFVPVIETAYETSLVEFAPGSWWDDVGIVSLVNAGPASRVEPVSPVAHSRASLIVASGAELVSQVPCDAMRSELCNEDVSVLDAPGQEASEVVSAEPRMEVVSPGEPENSESMDVVCMGEADGQEAEPTADVASDAATSSKEIWCVLDFAELAFDDDQVVVVCATPVSCHGGVSAPSCVTCETLP